MALYLVEVELAEPTKDVANAVIEHISGAFAATGGELVEAQVTEGMSRVYVILEGDDCAGVTLDKADIPGIASISEPINVRIVGADVEDIKKLGSQAGYLVEWDIPEEITMDKYLERKKASAPLYDTLDDVKFLRTYVREDTQKCLCFYDADTESAVRNARDVVKTPISRLYELAGQ